MFLSDLQKFGVAFIAASLMCFTLAVITFFDAKLISFGNLLFICGLVLVMGGPRCMAYIFSAKKRKSTAVVIVGVLLTLKKWAFTGFFVEIIGFLSLFADFSGVIIAFLKTVPGVSTVLNLPQLQPIINRISGGNILPI